jgi:hypothetical protein
VVFLRLFRLRLMFWPPQKAQILVVFQITKKPTSAQALKSLSPIVEKNLIFGNYSHCVAGRLTVISIYITFMIN